MPQRRKNSHSQSWLSVVYKKLASWLFQIGGVYCTLTIQERQVICQWQKNLRWLTFKQYSVILKHCVLPLWQTPPIYQLCSAKQTTKLFCKCSLAQASSVTVVAAFLHHEETKYSIFFSALRHSPVLRVTVPEALCKGIAGYLQLCDLKSRQKNTKLTSVLQTAVIVTWGHSLSYLSSLQSLIPYVSNLLLGLQHHVYLLLFKTKLPFNRELIILS